MKPLTADRIKGNWATLLVPFNEDDSINYALLGQELDRIVDSGVDGVYSNGTAGEFYNQTEEEFDRINGLMAEKCEAAGLPFQIGACHISPTISLHRLRRAKSLSPGAIQVILPDWYPPTREDSIRFLQRMAEEAEEIGLVLYNPPHAKVQLSPEDIAALAEAVPRIVGVKVAGGDDVWYEKIGKLCSNLSVFVPGHFLATGYTKGASGAYSNVACLNPAAAQRWYEQMQTDIDGALELEGRIQEFMFGHIVPYITERGYSAPAVDKFMASVGGWTEISPRLRWPYKSIPASDVERIRPVAANLLPEFF